MDHEIMKFNIILYFVEGAVTWKDSHHGFEHWRGRLSVGAAFCEWILTLLVIAFTLTFVSEFQNLKFRKPEISIITSFESSHCNNCNNCDAACDDCDEQCDGSRRHCKGLMPVGRHKIVPIDSTATTVVNDDTKTALFNDDLNTTTTSKVSASAMSAVTLVIDDDDTAGNAVSDRQKCSTLDV